MHLMDFELQFAYSVRICKQTFLLNMNEIKVNEAFGLGRKICLLKTGKKKITKIWQSIHFNENLQLQVNPFP